MAACIYRGKKNVKRRGSILHNYTPLTSYGGYLRPLLFYYTFFLYIYINGTEEFLRSEIFSDTMNEKECKRSSKNSLTGVRTQPSAEPTPGRGPWFPCSGTTTYSALLRETDAKDVKEERKKKIVPLTLPVAYPYTTPREQNFPCTPRSRVTTCTRHARCTGRGPGESARYPVAPWRSSAAPAAGAVASCPNR